MRQPGGNRMEIWKVRGWMWTAKLEHGYARREEQGVAEETRARERARERERKKKHHMYMEYIQTPGPGCVLHESLMIRTSHTAPSSITHWPLSPPLPSPPPTPCPPPPPPATNRRRPPGTPACCTTTTTTQCRLAPPPMCQPTNQANPPPPSHAQHIVPDSWATTIPHTPTKSIQSIQPNLSSLLSRCHPQVWAWLSRVID